MDDYISRQAAIEAICNACGKIDCDKMDKCEKLQLPPANCSEFPNNSDTISRQAAIDVLEERLQVNGYSNVALVSELNRSIGYLMRLPSVDAVEVVRCKDCAKCQVDTIFNQYWCGGERVLPNGFCNYGRRKDG